MKKEIPFTQGEILKYTGGNFAGYDPSIHNQVEFIEYANIFDAYVKFEGVGKVLVRKYYLERPKKKK